MYIELYMNIADIYWVIQLSLDGYTRVIGASLQSLSPFHVIPIQVRATGN